MIIFEYGENRLYHSGYKKTVRLNSSFPQYTQKTSRCGLLQLIWDSSQTIANECGEYQVDHAGTIRALTIEFLIILITLEDIQMRSFAT